MFSVAHKLLFFFFNTARWLLDTCARLQMESELSLTASFIPDGLNYFITINHTPSASCVVLPDVRRPQSHCLFWRLVTSCPLKDIPEVSGAGWHLVCVAPSLPPFVSMARNQEGRRKYRGQLKKNNEMKQKITISHSPLQLVISKSFPE